MKKIILTILCLCLFNPIIFPSDDSRYGINITGVTGTDTNYAIYDDSGCEICGKTIDDLNGEKRCITTILIHLDTCKECNNKYQENILRKEL